MFDHVGLNVTDLDGSVRFYSQALAALGHTLGHQDEQSASFGPPDAPALYLTQASNGKRSQTHVALSAADSQAVDGFHAAALGAGGTDNGAPAERPDYGAHYYAAYVLDPDGNNIEAVSTAG